MKNFAIFFCSLSIDRSHFLVGCLLALIAMSENVQASITTYTNQATWQGAAGTTTLETFDSSAVAPFAGAPGAGAIPAQAFNGFSVSGSYNGDNVGIASGSSSLSISGTKSLAWTEDPSRGGWVATYGNGGIGPLVTLTFDSPILSLGFDWKDADPTDQYNIEVQGQSTFTNPPFGYGTGAGFFGIVSDTPFSSVTFRSIAQGGAVYEGFAIDNVQTGGGVVPEPATLFVWSGLCLAVVSSVYAKKRKAMQAEA